MPSGKTVPERSLHHPPCGKLPFGFGVKPVGAKGTVICVISGEIAGHHLRRGNVGLQDIRVALVLQPPFVAAPEEEILVCARDRPAEVTSRIVIVLGALGDSLMVVAQSFAFRTLLRASK